LEHRDYPFDLMIEKLSPARQANRQPLVNVVYGYQNFADVHVDVKLHSDAPTRTAAADDAPVRWDAFDFSFQISKFDLTLFVTEERDTLRLTFEYDTSLFLADTIRRQVHTLAQFAELVARSGIGGEVDYPDGDAVRPRDAGVQ
jgi:non-ribosomal peptide synthetase component F